MKPKQENFQNDKEIKSSEWKQKSLCLKKGKTLRGLELHFFKFDRHLEV